MMRNMANEPKHANHPEESAPQGSAPALYSPQADPFNPSPELIRQLAAFAAKKGDGLLKEWGQAHQRMSGAE
jgi:hypothetical protein